MLPPTTLRLTHPSRSLCTIFVYSHCPDFRRNQKVWKNTFTDSARALMRSKMPYSTENSVAVLWSFSRFTHKRDGVNMNNFDGDVIARHKILSFNLNRFENRRYKACRVFLNEYFANFKQSRTGNLSTPTTIENYVSELQWSFGNLNGNKININTTCEAERISVTLFHKTDCTCLLYLLLPLSFFPWSDWNRNFGKIVWKIDTEPTLNWELYEIFYIFPTFLKVKQPQSRAPCTVKPSASSGKWLTKDKALYYGHLFIVLMLHHVIIQNFLTISP